MSKAVYAPILIDPMTVEALAMDSASLKQGQLSLWPETPYDRFMRLVNESAARAQENMLRDLSMKYFGLDST